MPFDGKSFGEEMVGIVRGFVEQAIAPLVAENAALAARLAEVEASDVIEGLRFQIEGLARMIEELPLEPDLSGFATRDELVEVRGAIPAIPEPADLSGFATKADLDTILDAIPVLPEAPDLSGFATRDDLAEVRSAIPTLPEAPDLSRFATLDDVAEVRASIAPSPDLSGFMALADGEEIRGLMVRQTAEIRAEIHEAIAAVELKEGPQGKLSIAREWADDGVTYAGEVRTYAGATWQATRDTGKAPGSADWICLAGKGEAGTPAPRFRICGTYNETADYTELDIVACNGASFVARSDDPGPCPGAGWQLWAKQGRPGDKGDKVKADPGPRPVAFVVDEEAVALTLALDDGTTLTADLYPLLAQVAK